MSKSYIYPIVITAVGGVVIASTRLLSVPSSDSQEHPQPTYPLIKASENMSVHRTVPSGHGAESPVGSGSVPVVATFIARSDFLSNPKNPTEAFEAYKIINRCVLSLENAKLMSSLPVGSETESARRSLGETIKFDATACQDIDQRNIADRARWVDLAAKANVPGAALEFLSTGPFGDPTALESRPDDPLVLKWKLQAVEYLLAAGKGGDVNALDALSNIYQSGIIADRDLELALTYTIASLEMQSAQGKKSIGGERLAKVLSAGLTQQQVSAARASGLHLASQCCVK